MKLSFSLISLVALAATVSNPVLADSNSCHRICFPSGNERRRVCRTFCDTAPEIFRFSCFGNSSGASVSLQGTFELGQYYRMGHSAVRSGQFELISARSGGPVEKSQIFASSGDYQDSGHAVLRAFVGQSQLEVRIDGINSSIRFSEANEIALSCSMEN